jgi:hypothetical protein
VDQSAITGESLAVDKYIGDIAYYTCGVKRGKARSPPLINFPPTLIILVDTLVLCHSERNSKAILRRQNCLFGHECVNHPCIPFCNQTDRPSM